MIFLFLNCLQKAAAFPLTSSIRRSACNGANTFLTFLLPGCWGRPPVTPPCGAAVTPDRSGPDQPRTVFTLDLTSADGLFSAGQFLIQPDDLIYVSESPVTAAHSILSILGIARNFSN